MNPVARTVVRTAAAAATPALTVAGIAAITLSPRDAAWAAAEEIAESVARTGDFEPCWHRLGQIGRISAHLYWVTEPAARPGIRFGTWLGRTQVTVGRTQATWMFVLEEHRTPAEQSALEDAFFDRTGIRVGDTVVVDDTTDRPGGAL